MFVEHHFDPMLTVSSSSNPSCLGHTVSQPQSMFGLVSTPTSNAMQESTKLYSMFTQPKTHNPFASPASPRSSLLPPLLLASSPLPPPSPPPPLPSTPSPLPLASSPPQQLLNDYTTTDTKSAPRVPDSVWWILGWLSIFPVALCVVIFTALSICGAIALSYQGATNSVLPTSTTHGPLRRGERSASRHRRVV